MYGDDTGGGDEGQSVVVDDEEAEYDEDVEVDGDVASGCGDEHAGHGHEGDSDDDAEGALAGGGAVGEPGAGCDDEAADGCGGEGQLADDEGYDDDDGDVSRDDAEDEAVAGGVCGSGHVRSPVLDVVLWGLFGWDARLDIGGSHECRLSGGGTIRRERLNEAAVRLEGTKEVPGWRNSTRNRRRW